MPVVIFATTLQWLFYRFEEPVVTVIYTIEITSMDNHLRTAFIKAAIWHGTLEEAEQLLATHPSLATADIYTAAITGNAAVVEQLLAQDPSHATALAEPYGGNALVYLCLSKYLRLDKSRSENFLRAATLLLDAGADPNGGFWTKGAYPEFETPLYGAAGVAHHAPLTKLLLQYGADPNDGEAAYHSPETDELDAMIALVETGKLTEENLSIMLIRKHDWHDYEGAKYLLAHGANPNPLRERGWAPLHHALKRVNSLAMITLLIDHGADPFVVNDGLNGIERAAREGRSDVLKMYAQEGISIELEGIHQLIAACLMGDAVTVQQIIAASPSLVEELLTMGDTLLARCCLCHNGPGVQQLLAMGIDVNTPYKTGDGYFGIPEGSLPIHVAAWIGYPAMVKLLIEHGAWIDMPDKNGLTPLALAIKACVDSYWTERRSPESVKALLEAGASAHSIALPTGYDAVDAVLQQFRKN